MFSTNYSIHGTIAALPAGPAPSAQGSATRPRPASEPAPTQPAPAPTNDDREVQQRYFEDMVNSAADLLLRTQIPGAVSRFDL